MTLKEQLIREIEQAPENLLEEFLDFILFTKARQQIQTNPPPSPPTTADWVDPLANFIGSTNHGTLTSAIDATLYE